MASRARTVTGAVLLWLAALAALLALVAATSGGFELTVAGVPIHVHAVLRPIVAALALTAMAIATLGSDAARMGSLRVTSFVQRRGGVVALVIALVAGLATYRETARIAAGADASGYLSQARLWRSFELRAETPLAHELSVVHGQFAFTPLGYQPSGVRGVIVPGYPPGYPIHLAIAGAMGGEAAAFAVVPLCTAGLVLVAFALGRRVGGGETGLLAATVCATSPMLLFQAVQPMSDVPAAFWWSLAILLMTSDTVPAAIAASLSAAVACGVRPNLFVMAPVVALLAAWWNGWTRVSIARSIGFLAAPGIAAAAIAVLHRDLYGSVTTSGYGAISTLFALDHVWPNLGRYAAWAVFTQSALILLCLAGPFAVRSRWLLPTIPRDRAERVAWSSLIFFVALQGFYLLYLVFDGWGSFRFLLPALPGLLVMQAAVIAALCGTAPPRLQGFLVLLVAILAASWGVGRARGLGTFNLVDSEQRYLDVAQFVREQPPGAVIVTVQHSGSIAHYTAAPIVRWDWLEPGELDRVVSDLRATPRQPLAALDDFEEAGFRARFAGSRTVQQLGTPIFSAGGGSGITTRVYPLSALP